ncbi:MULTISPECIES: aminopeptidase P family protein [Cryobacterium]|uniref:Xaa-Pro aminopeptidase n=1 Tax=Cryobacterium levicorallinum TaxID=995038 RepID=A0A1I3BE20_9MICO|nr:MULTISPECIES: aminopeptidase P family protein [Cryobacterium]TFB88892.1 aminopeptidase P family protein [Cryobacterium levicorallinum]TFD59221.1 aminopeptidase P family protein [Cryobacterium sp. Hh38]GEP28057.1 Xaa-Pro aminopeptidase [Cryobacterium levicorallinum]SFH60543.1 Xaa-Pro aminopeptidase [Cryobacterium levicorallinum]
MADTTAPALIPAARSNENRSTTPRSTGFKAFIASGWAERTDVLPPAREQAPFAAARRARLSAQYPGQRLIIPAGRLKQRSNDTDYAFRAHSAFAHLTGWGSDSEPGAVLVLEPAAAVGHDATLYFRERAGRDSDEFYANPDIGEFWIGPRPSVAQVASDLAVAVRGIADLAAVLKAVDSETLVLREADPTFTEQVDEARLRFAAERVLSSNATDSPFSIEINAEHEPDAGLARDLSELRLVKDAWEIAQMRLAVAATARGFDDVIADLPRSSQHARGERLVEGVFNTRARSDGNTVGYDTIAASGPHACILHWTRNDGVVAAGDLILIDAGVELDSYYTADITRTLPVNGVYSDVQRQVYETVREAADAALAVVRPGAIFRDVHAAAMQVIARRTAEWGMLPVTAEEALLPDNGQHRRYMVHGTSHHLGIDVHDCAQARRDMYMDGVLEPGMVFTIEPGLYFQPDDLTVPAEFRGIGVRIEDDILVTATGAENLSAAIPRTANEVEAWIAAKHS